jgi:hypothetical protein
MQGFTDLMKHVHIGGDGIAQQSVPNTANSHVARNASKRKSLHPNVVSSQGSCAVPLSSPCTVQQCTPQQHSRDAITIEVK